jgi:hypothetical protein
LLGEDMFQNYNQQFMLDKLNREKERINEMISNYQVMQNPQQPPINNIINTTQAQKPNENLIACRILNENEEVDNLYVPTKTLFINDNAMVIKDVDGKTEKWKIKKVYPIDPKDEKIDQLTRKIEELERILNNEHTKSIEPIVECDKPASTINVNANTESKTTSRSNSKSK